MILCASDQNQSLAFVKKKEPQELLKKIFSALKKIIINI